MKKAGIQKLIPVWRKNRRKSTAARRSCAHLYENLADGVIDREEYQELKKTYTRRKAEAEEQAEVIRVEMSQAIDSSEKGPGLDGAVP